MCSLPASIGEASKLLRMLFHLDPELSKVHLLVEANVVPCDGV